MPDSDRSDPVGVAPTPEDTWRTQVALFRYTLILPLLRHDRQRDGTKRQLREAIAGQPHTIPHSQRRTVSVPTLRRWEKAYRKGGFDALKPRSRRDRGASRSLSAETLDRAEALKRELPTRSARTVVNILKREDAGPIREERIAPRTLRRHLAARGATRARLAKRATAFRRFEREHFGDLWQSDALDGPKLADPADPEAQRQTFLFAFLDDHSRLVPHAQFYWNEQLPRLEDCLKRAISRYGCPMAIYADQGSVYRADQLDTACATLGIQRILARPYSPEAKGKIERFFGFVRSDFLPELVLSPSVQTLNDLNQSLLAWIEVVYHRKVHSETCQAPLDRFRHDPAPSVRRVDPLALRNAFLYRVSRQVTKTGHVHFQSLPPRKRGVTATPSPASSSARRSNCATTPLTCATSRSGSTASASPRPTRSTSRPQPNLASHPTPHPRPHPAPAWTISPCSARNASSCCASSCRPFPLPA